MSLQRTDFWFDLPEALIAQAPLADRSASRLLLLDGRDGAVDHRQFRDLPRLLAPGDLLVFNDTRVIPARLFGNKDSGGRVEVLVERVLPRGQALAHVRASKRPRPGSRLLFGDGQVVVEVLAAEADLLRLQFPADEPVEMVLERLGHMPLPPYIQRPDTAADRERYQTVYGQRPGAVAAPTAGLHFSDALLADLTAAGIEQAFVTLHVGAGTFQPVRVDDISTHRMHSERIEVPDTTRQAIADARARGSRVVAVGTTVVRSLESCADGRGGVLSCARETDIFITPGYRFQVVDGLITNFHLPESTLLMLVSAFAGREHVLSAYREAVQQQYRFFSYGDAMLLWPAPEALEART